MRTTIPDVYAAGDVCETLETLTGKVSLTPIWPAVRAERGSWTEYGRKDVELAGTFAYQNAMSFFLAFLRSPFGWPEPPDDSYQVETDVSPDYYQKVILKRAPCGSNISRGSVRCRNFPVH